MRRVYCDWCETEITTGVMSAAFTRRISLNREVDKHKVDVVIKLEFPANDRPGDLCFDCVSKLLTRSAERLLEAQGPIL